MVYFVSLRVFREAKSRLRRRDSKLVVVYRCGGEKAISRSSSRSIILGKTSRIGLAARTVRESDTEDSGEMHELPAMWSSYPIFEIGWRGRGGGKRAEDGLCDNGDEVGEV